MDGEKPQEMERMVDKLEAMFRKAESDVEYMSRKLESEFQEGAQDKDQTSPLELSSRLQQVKHDYKSIMEEVNSVKRAQEDMVTSVKQQLQSAAHALGRIHQSCPEAELPDVSQQEELVRSMLGMALSSSAEANPNQSSATASASQNSGEKLSSKSDSSASGLDEEENLSPVDTTFEIGPSPADQRAQSGEMVPITEEEFTSVSELVRARAKLDDVNRVYSRLYEHFRTENNKSALNVPEMSKMGMKITGATGEAKLKTLRALKIINITRTGAVKLL